MTAPEERAAAREQVAYQVKCAAYNQPLMGVDWTRPENQRWLDVADQIIESALATHPRRLEELTEENDAMDRLIKGMNEEALSLERRLEEARAALAAIENRALADSVEEVASEVASGRTINDMYVLAKDALARLSPPPSDP